MRTGSARAISLRARITLIAAAMFSLAVVVGALVLIAVLRVSLLRELDSSAQRAVQDVAALVASDSLPPVLAVGGSVQQVQVVDADDVVVSVSLGGDAVKSILTPDELRRARAGERLTVRGARLGEDESLRVTALGQGAMTILAATGVGRVNDSVRILTLASALGGPVAVAAMAGLTWWVVGLALRPVAALRHGAAEITAAGLANQRLPVPAAQDEVYRLAVTLNAMLDRIDTATARQRTFVGDAAHELRSPIASLRVQLEVAARLGPENAWPSLVEDVLVDVERLDRLVRDLLALARLDEAGGAVRGHEPVALDELLTDVVARGSGSRVPVTLTSAPSLVDGDVDALRRVFVNLLDNATRHARTGVHVSVGPGRVVVADDGAGIPEAERELVFDRFYRLAESRSRGSGGTGLGLSIVRDVVRAHRGSVILSDNAPGLRAEVTLPRSG